MDVPRELRTYHLLDLQSGEHRRAVRNVRRAEGLRAEVGGAPVLAADDLPARRPERVA